MKEIQLGTDPLNKYEYVYAGVNPLVSSLTRSNGSQTVYDYNDPLKRLTAIDNQDSAQAVIDKHEFTYNDLDVIDTETVTTNDLIDNFTVGQTTYDYNNVNQLTNASDVPNPYEYDDDGNMTKGYTPDGYQFTATYDAENRLKTISYDDGSNDYETRYFYRGDGFLARIDKWDDTVTPGTMEKTSEVRFIRANFLPIQERDETNSITREYTWGLDKGGGIGGLLNLKEGTNDYSYLYDGKGNVMAVLNSTQIPVVSYRYDEFGNLMKKVDTFDQPFRFSTKRYDEQIGHYNFGYRFYLPSIGKWTTRDPLGEAGGINLYGFVGNSPINAIDPWGLWRWPWSIYDEAIEDAASKYPNSQHNGLGDAYRHCLASCMMTKEDGVVSAETFGWANEERGDWTHNQECGERAMDDFNNQKGRDIGLTTADTSDCATQCLDAANRGELKTYKPNTTRGYWY